LHDRRDTREAGVALDPLEQLDAPQHRHHAVEHQQVWRQLRGQHGLPGNLAIGGRADDESRIIEHVANDLEIHWFVIDDKYSPLRHEQSYPGTPSRVQPATYPGTLTAGETGLRAG
jgi:hypothetical protein